MKKTGEIVARRHTMSPIALLLAASTVGCLSVEQAQAQVRVVTWNISNYTGGRVTDIQNVVYGVIPSPLAMQGQSMSPDIIALQEIVSASALNAMVTALNTAPGSPGDWAGAPYVNGNDNDNALVYRTSRFTLIDNKTWTISLGVSGSPPLPPRNTYRYDLMPVGYTAPQSVLSVYSAHMKAQDSGSDDDNMRLTEASRVRDNAEGQDTNPSNGEADGLPAGYNFILGGDFNGQTSTESFYVDLTNSQPNNTGRFFDPINSPGSWNNSGTYRYIHTQDPSGAGGMDDRHDQLLIGASLKDATGNPAGWHYIGSPTLAYSTSTWNDPNHSYRAWGNDGTSFNLTLTTTGNTFVGPTIAQAIINAETAAGGHIPVYADFRVPARAGASAVSLDFGTVRQGALAPTRIITIGNNANVALFGSNGIDALNYSFGAAAGFTVPAGSFFDNAGGAANPHSLTMPTTTVGPKNATLIITTDSPEEPTISVTLTGTVLPPNTPPNANAGSDQTLTDSNNNGSEVVTLDGTLSDDPDGTINSYVWKIGPTTILTGATGNVTLPVGVSNIILTVTDNENATDTDNVAITINPPNTPPTANAGGPYTGTDTDNTGFEPVTLDASASTDSDGVITNYEWKLGETTLCTGTSPLCNWNAPVGESNVTVTVTDDDGAINTTGAVVTITAGGPVCDSIDFNNDTSMFDPQDIDAFLSVYAEGPCIPENATCNDIDFNNDTSIFDPCDIDSFLLQFSEGPCTSCGQ